MNRAVDRVKDLPVWSLTSLVIKSSQRVVNDRSLRGFGQSIGGTGSSNGDPTIVDRSSVRGTCIERVMLAGLGSFDRCVKLLIEVTRSFHQIDQAEEDAWSGGIVVPSYAR